MIVSITYLSTINRSIIVIPVCVIHFFQYGAEDNTWPNLKEVLFQLMLLEVSIQCGEKALQRELL